MAGNDALVEAFAAASQAMAEVGRQIADVSNDREAVATALKAMNSASDATIRLYNDVRHELASLRVAVEQLTGQPAGDAGGGTLTRKARALMIDGAPYDPPPPVMRQVKRLRTRERERRLRELWCRKQTEWPLARIAKELNKIDQESADELSADRVGSWAGHLGLPYRDARVETFGLTRARLVQGFFSDAELVEMYREWRAPLPWDVPQSAFLPDVSRTSPGCLPESSPKPPAILSGTSRKPPRPEPEVAVAPHEPKPAPDPKPMFARRKSQGGSVLKMTPASVPTPIEEIRKWAQDNGVAFAGPEDIARVNLARVLAGKFPFAIAELAA